MSVSIFEKLLGSYSGMRKRTWSPLVVEATEAGQVKSWKGKLASKATDNATKKSEYENAKTSITQALNSPTGTKDDVIRQQLASQAYGTAILGTSTVYVSTYQGVLGFGSQKSSAVITALDELIRGLGEEEAEKSTTEKAGDTAVKDSDDKTEDEAPAHEPPQFSESDKKSAKKAFANLVGMAEDAVAIMLLKLEKCINTPSKNTKLGQLFDSIGSDNPTLEQRSKEQLTKLAGHLFSIADEHIVRGKDGRKYIRKSALSSSQVAAMKVMTVRNKGDIYFGRPEVSVPGYEDLQRQASQGDANYGFHLGQSLNQLGPFLKDVRFITDDDLPETMDDKSYDALPQAFLSSKAGGSGSNDATGKLTEYFWELGFAIQTGDKKAVSTARDKVKKGLKALGALPQNLNSLECPLTNGNMDIMQDILDEVEQAGSIPAFARNLVREVGLSVESFQTALNIKPKDVVLVDSPATESKMGERPDVIAFISPGASINVKVLQVGGTPVRLHVIQPQGDNDGDDALIAKYGNSIIGTTMLNTSIKHKKRKGGTTRMGSFAFQHMVEPSSEDAPSAYEKLHTAETDRLVAAGHMTPKQQQACRSALKRDRAHHAAVTRRLRAMTGQNRKDVVDFLMSTSLTGSFTVGGRQKYQDEAESIAEGLKSEDPEVQRVAEIRIQQLARMRRQSGLKSGSEYARASALNDAIGSFAAEMEEPIYIDSPQELRVTTNRQVMDEVAKACWDPEGTVQVTPARTTVKAGDGSSMFGMRRVARKDKNPGYEFEMFSAAEAVATKPIPKATIPPAAPKKKPRSALSRSLAPAKAKK